MSLISIMLKITNLLFAVNIFVSAFLLFAIQPFIAKTVLPGLGGGPQIWNTCMFFFQFSLLLGYGYAHILSRLQSFKIQAAIHFLLLIISLKFIPVAVGNFQAPPLTDFPSFWLIYVLAISIGLPFFIIASCSPLFQKWYSLHSFKSSSDPYFLYATSNAGSLLALLLYPFLIEPLISLPGQNYIWGIGYFIFMILTLIIIIGTLFHTRRDQHKHEIKKPSSLTITYKDKIAWVLLSFTPSSLLYGVTTYISTDIAAFPLLWVIPLSIYLMTFILSFSDRCDSLHLLITKLFPVCVIVLTIFLLFGAEAPLIPSLFWHLFTFFVMAYFCHGKLAKMRPHAQDLTQFYLWLSFGGMLGGLFNALAAPYLFDGTIEYQIAIILACVLRTNTKEMKQIMDRWLSYVLPVIFAIFLLCIITLDLYDKWVAPSFLGRFLYLAIPILICLSFRFHPLRLAVGIATLLFIWTLPLKSPGITYADRSFFGVHRIKYDKNNHYYAYLHGNVIHGIQSLDQRLEHIPTTYYHPTGPLGDIMQNLRQHSEHGHIANIGLGVGSIAAYAFPNETWTYFEIDPAVQEVAENETYFKYLANSQAPYEIVLGDGRLQIAKSPNGQFDLLVLDAFSSDSVPTHLLTLEAIGLYFSKLKDNGFLAVHISNRHLDLELVLGDLAEELGLFCYVRHDIVSGNAPGIKMSGKESSSWAVLAENKETLDLIVSKSSWEKARSSGSGHYAWTDNYSNIVTLLKVPDFIKPIKDFLAERAQAASLN